MRPLAQVGLDVADRRQADDFILVQFASQTFLEPQHEPDGGKRIPARKGRKRALLARRAEAAARYQKGACQRPCYSLNAAQIAANLRRCADDQHTKMIARDALLPDSLQLTRKAFVILRKLDG